MFLKLFNESPDSSEAYFFVVFFLPSPECLTTAENVANCGRAGGRAAGGTSRPESMLGLALPNCSGL